MTGVAKGLIIGGVVLLVILIAVVAGGVYLVSKHGGELVEKGKVALNEGETFGKGTDNDGCVDETLRRYKKEPGMGSAISSGIFVRACLERSKKTPGFCDNVPGPTEFMKSAEFRQHKCSEANLPSDSYCPGIFGEVQKYCHTPEKN
jgi:hypothetical protein